MPFLSFRVWGRTPMPHVTFSLEVEREAPVAYPPVRTPGRRGVCLGTVPLHSGFSWSGNDMQGRDSWGDRRSREVLWTMVLQTLLPCPKARSWDLPPNHPSATVIYRPSPQSSHHKGPPSQTRAAQRAGEEEPRKAAPTPVREPSQEPHTPLSTPGHWPSLRRTLGLSAAGRAGRRRLRSRRPCHLLPSGRKLTVLWKDRKSG